jgi:spermidine synthase
MLMTNSLFIEHHAHGLAFYINGDLQFDSADEAIYHEHLVLPAIALASQRFPATPLRVLIGGGGDGLAARDALRFSQVSDITLVDYDPAVLELGRTVFQPYNRGSLLPEPDAPLGGSRVTVFTQEAFEFIGALPDACYHVVICDFTCPTRPAETQVYSREWYAEIKRVLVLGGILAVNGVSPEHTTIAFWCLYQTLLAAGLATKPMRLSIPSFTRHEYGDWGFFLASPHPIAASELGTLSFPPDLQALQPDSWQQAFRFPTALADDRHQVCIHTLESPQLFYYLMNFNKFFADGSSDPALSMQAAPEAATGEEWIDFLEIEEPGTGLIGAGDRLQLETLAKSWLAQLEQTRHSPAALCNQAELLPVHHVYHTPQMTREWLGHLRHLLNEIDGKQFLSSLLERAQELPPSLVRELKQLIEKLRTGQPIVQISPETAELITLLSMVLITANLIAPDAVFAKGYSSGFRSGGSSSTYYGSDYYGASGEPGFGWIGFIMMLLGGYWMAHLLRRRDD